MTERAPAGMRPHPGNQSVLVFEDGEQLAPAGS